MVRPHPFTILQLLSLYFFVCLSFQSSSSSAAMMCSPNGVCGIDASTTTQTASLENQIDQAVKRVSPKGQEWRSLSVETKIRLLEEMIQNAIQYRKEWVACQQAYLKVDSTDLNPDHGWAMFDILVRGPANFGGYANGILKSLKQVQKNGNPPPPVATRSIIAKNENDGDTADTKTVATIWPSPWSVTDSIEAFGMKAEMICNVEDTSQLQPSYEEFIQQHNSAEMGCAAVLAAGNFDAPTDLLSELFVKGRVCVYKPNPINDAVIPVLKKIMKPVLDLGYVEFAPSSVEAAKLLVQHEGIQEIVFTGSKETLDRIIWGGSKEEQDKNKANQTPINTTPVCSELGSVTPWIIVPGPQWGKKSIDDHAKALVFAKMSNNGHVCVSPQVIIWPKDWKYRQLFRERVEYWLSQHPGTVAFYPGSHQTHANLQQHPNAKLIHYDKAKRTDEEKPEPIFPREQRPLFIGDMSLDNEQDKKLLRQEAWCPALMELPIDTDEAATKPMDYLRKAVDIAQSNLYGSLSINILMDNKTIRKNKKELDHIIAHEMPYGLVGVNIWPCYVSSLSQVRWGAFAGSSESGTGTLANANMYTNIEKTVVRAPFHHLARKAIQVMPPRKAHLVFSRFTTYKLKPNMLTQIGLFVALFLGV